MAAVSVDIDSPLLIATVCKSKSLHTTQHNQTMATSPTNKRHKSGAVELSASHAVGDVIDSILNVDREAFKEHVGSMDRETFTLLLNRFSELGQDMEDTSPAFSPDSDFIAHGDEEGNICLWNRTKGLVANWRNDDDDDDVNVDYIYFSPDCNLLVTVGNSSNIKIWDLANENRCLREWTQDNVYSVAFSPDGKCIATAGGVGRPVFLRNLSDGTTSQEIRPGVIIAVTIIVFHRMDERWHWAVVTGAAGQDLSNCGNYTNQMIQASVCLITRRMSATLLILQVGYFWPRLRVKEETSSYGMLLQIDVFKF
jgi:WD40 repeat protein